VVAKCDHPESVVANCNRKNINIESLIRIVRGQKVMLDSDLAMLYGVSTSRLNEQLSAISTAFLKTLCSNSQKMNGVL
jgi:hypothetical protein